MRYAVACLIGGALVMCVGLSIVAGIGWGLFAVGAAVVGAGFVLVDVGEPERRGQ